MIATLNAEINIKAEIFNYLREKPKWWLNLISIDGVYVEIRKGNIVDVYFEGGRMAELRYSDNNLTATCHPKYLGINVPQGCNPQYIDCLKVLQSNPTYIIRKIREHYSQKDGKGGESISEKKIQGDMIYQQSPIFLDSEFAHRYEDGKRDTIRFDLVTIKNDKLIFVELKRIGDNRILNKDDDKPEILEQMNKYAQFIKFNKEKLIDYYKKLYNIKNVLGLPVPSCNLDKLTICEIPHLIIRDTYAKYGSKRNNRIRRIMEILDNAPFTYSIEK